jgi:hypothetical protein
VGFPCELNDSKRVKSHSVVYHELALKAELWISGNSHFGEVETHDFVFLLRANAALGEGILNFEE